MQSEKCTTVYFDSNVLIDLCDGLRPKLKEYVLSEAKKRTTVFPFTATQVLEITTYPKSERCVERLDFLSRLSNDLYFVHSVWDHECRAESPHSAYSTNTEAFPKWNLPKLFSWLIPLFLLKAGRDHLGIDSVVLNNLRGAEAVEYIDAALLKESKRNGSRFQSIRDHVTYNRELTIKHHGRQWESMGTNSTHMLYYHDLETVFGLLETYGYHSDKKKVYAKGSRYADAGHISAASHCDYLVSRDKGMRYRAEAAYSVLGIATIVVSTEEYEGSVLEKNV